MEAKYTIRRPNDTVQGLLMLSADDEGSWSSVWLESGIFPALKSKGAVKDGGLELLSAGSKLGEFRTIWEPAEGDGAHFSLSFKEGENWIVLIDGRYRRRAVGTELTSKGIVSYHGDNHVNKHS